MAADCLSLVGVEVRSGQKLCFEATFPGLPKALGQMLTGPSQDSCQDLGGAGWELSLAPLKPLIVDDSSSNPFPPVPQARLGAWPPVCWQDCGGGAARQLQTVRAKRQVYSRVYSAEGGGRGQSGHTPCQGPIRLPVPTFLPTPSSSALGQNRHRPQGLVAGQS